MVNRGIKTFIDNFDRAQAFTTTPGMNGWTIKDTSSAGTPTYLCVTEDEGGFALTLDNTSEAQVVTLYQGDVLAYDVRHLKSFWWQLKVSGIDAQTTLVAGMASAQNDTADSVATNLWFRIQGSASLSALLVETDDGTTDNDDKFTGATLGTTYKKLLCDLSNGIRDVRWFIDGVPVAFGNGAAADDGRFDLSNLTAGLNVQPFLQIQKGTGTGIPAVSGAQFGVTYEWAYGA